MNETRMEERRRTLLRRLRELEIQAIASKQDSISPPAVYLEIKTYENGHMAQIGAYFPEIFYTRTKKAGLSKTTAYTFGAYDGAFLFLPLLPPDSASESAISEEYEVLELDEGPVPYVRPYNKHVRCLSVREALEQLLQFLAPIYFGLDCKPVLAAYSLATIRCLAKALARHQLAHTMLAMVEQFLLLDTLDQSQPQPGDKQQPQQQQLVLGPQKHLVASKGLEDFLGSMIPCWVEGSCSASWPPSDVVAMALFLAVSQKAVKRSDKKVVLRNARFEALTSLRDCGMPATVLPPLDEGQETNRSLFIEDVSFMVTEDMLKERIRQICPIKSLKLIMNPQTQAPLGYAYVNFYAHSQALKVLTELDKTVFHGMSLRVAWHDKERGNFERLPEANVFIKNFIRSVDARRLQNCFQVFGRIFTCKVVVNQGPASTRYGFVQFYTEAAAEAAITVMDQIRVKEIELFVAIKKGAEVRLKEETTTNRTDKAVVIKHSFLDGQLSPEEKQLRHRQLLGQLACLGHLDSWQIPSSNSSSFHQLVAEFSRKSSADKAVSLQAIQGRDVEISYQSESGFCEEGVQEYFRGRALADNVRETPSVRIFVGNLDPTITAGRLKGIFMPSGRVLVAKVMRNNEGESLGYGFVIMESKLTALTAKKRLDGTEINGNCLTVLITEPESESAATRAPPPPQPPSSAKPLPSTQPSKLPKPVTHAQYPTIPVIKPKEVPNSKRKQPRETVKEYSFPILTTLYNPAASSHPYYDGGSSEPPAGYLPVNSGILAPEASFSHYHHYQSAAAESTAAAVSPSSAGIVSSGASALSAPARELVESWARLLSPGDAVGDGRLLDYGHPSGHSHLTGHNYLPGQGPLPRYGYTFVNSSEETESQYRRQSPGRAYENSFRYDSHRSPSPSPRSGSDSRFRRAVSPLSYVRSWSPRRSRISPPRGDRLRSRSRDRYRSRSRDRPRSISRERLLSISREKLSFLSRDGRSRPGLDAARSSRS